MTSRKNANAFLIVVTVTALTVGLLGSLPSVKAYSEDVYYSLVSSRDALLNQRSALIQAIGKTKSQIQAMETKLKTLEAYLHQTESDLRDVEYALKRR